MSKSLSFELDMSRSKPIFNIVTSGNKIITCMLDTGAEIPVWCGNESLLSIFFPYKELVREKFPLGGFGKGYDKVDVYRIPLFRLGVDLRNFVVFKDLHIAVSYNRNFGCNLILSSTMFSRFDYYVLNRGLSNSVLKLVYDDDVYVMKLDTYGKYAEKISCNVLESYAEVFEDAGNIAAMYREVYKE